MLNVNENINMNGNIVTDDINQKMIVNMNANLNNIGTVLNINFNIIDMENVIANQTSVQAQFNSFLESVRTKLTELGYKITL
jgi:hypothetical protein